MRKRWREFELLISRIERLLAPKGAVVKSPDHVKDKVTGGMREVDASIRYAVGSVDVLITVECRHRGAVPDVTWIEQLATKRQSIGASATIAVSKKGVTRPAIICADRCGIELRLVKDITNKEILAWLARIQITNEVAKAGLRHIRVKVYDEDDDIPLSNEVLEAVCRDRLWAKIFYSEADKKEVAIEEFLRVLAEQKRATAARRRLGTSLRADLTADDGVKMNLKPGDSLDLEMEPGYMDLYDDVPTNAGGLARNQTHVYNLEYGGLLVQTVKGPRYVKQVELAVALAKEISAVPISRKTNYSKGDESVGNFAESDIELFQGNERKRVTLSLSIPDRENGPLAAMVTSNDNGATNKDRKG